MTITVTVPVESWADYLRLIDAALSAVLCVTWGFAAVGYARTFDHRAVMVVLLGYALTTVAGQVGALGSPGSWVTVLLLIVTVAAVAVTARFAVKARREQR